MNCQSDDFLVFLLKVKIQSLDSQQSKKLDFKMKMKKITCFISELIG
ncbi:hypothetical protein Mic7113_2966 [Allocoleopsis franciscana PCC 7113]|uniref:Uncharacterized protein n=1 Tax=Allocoleopsis franciscana PCC 7113 TaxID=1173027 RepID=K9WG44_9CYAN|nr:hypothetical protein Mic7113_2966 [Allocoleopsis franciscana PCC 7113]